MCRIPARRARRSPAFTPLLSADNAPGFNFSSPHGVEFVADKGKGAEQEMKDLAFELLQMKDIAFDPLATAGFAGALSGGTLSAVDAAALGAKLALLGDEMGSYAESNFGVGRLGNGGATIDEPITSQHMLLTNPHA
jgi:hypothetical protein